LVDRHFAAPQADPRVRQVTGNIADTAVLSAALEGGVDCVFHLASIPGGLAEKDFDLGLVINLVATQTLLELLRLQGNAPRLVFASTIGVYGVPMPDVIDESLEPAPSLSYGAQKLIGEILITDYSRRGYVDGRSLRLPGIVARPPAASGMMSAFLSDIITKLSAGETFTCPVAAHGMSWWMSRTCVVENFIHAAELSANAAKAQRVWLLPVLHASLGDIVAAIAQSHGQQVLERVTYQDNPALRAQFANYPPMRCPRSIAAGFKNDGTVENLVQRALD
jgi:nucleoside-diphosphate-sugar epimerase